MKKIAFLTMLCLIVLGMVWGQEPTTAKEYFAMGMDYMDSDYDRAIEAFTAALKIDPTIGNFGGSAYRYRSDCYFEKGDLNNALKDINQAIKHNPYDPYLYQSRAYIYRDKKDYNKALADIKKAMYYCQERPYLAIELLRDRGEIYYLKKDYKKAIADLEGASSSIEGAAELLEEVRQAQSAGKR